MENLSGLEYIKRNKLLIIEKFAKNEFYTSSEIPATIFMAGSPGAGKTEFSKNLIEILEKPIVRIDADDIRDIIPGYNGANSDKFQRACIKGVEILYDYVLRNKMDAIVDGTFASFDVAKRNIERALEKNRKVAIFYIFQRPELAWKFTKIREEKEGRHISSEVFIDAFFKSKENVDKIKNIFRSRVTVFLVEKDFENNMEKFNINIDRIDNFLKINYTFKNLKDILK